MRYYTIIVLFITLFYDGSAVAQFADITAKAGINYEHHGFFYIGGIVAADFNGDGYCDIYITNGEGYPNQLYINNKDLTFREIALSARVGDMSEAWGAIAGDFDNDGDMDIYLSNYFSANRLFQNDGNANFTDVTEAAGVGNEGPSTSVALADIDNDGYLDIYVLNRSQAIDDYANTLYRNNGDGTFTDITSASGTGDLGTGLAVGFFDYDNDRFMDIYVVNEFERDVLYHNNQDGTFTNMASILNNPVPGAGMGVDFSDIDNDGDFDIYVTNLFKDYLFVNNGNGTFSLDERSLGITENTMAWGVGFFDRSNNGYEDIYIVNGAMVWPDNYDEKNIFFKNNGNGTFTNMASSFGIENGGDGRAAAIADFNNDGFMDIIMMNVLREYPILYINNASGNSWITIKLEGTFSNRNGIGAKIKVEAGSLVQIKEVSAGGSFASMHTLDIGFGLRKETNIDKITVYWPSGNVQELTNVNVNQIKTIIEPDELNVVGIEEERLLSSFNLQQNYPNPFNPTTTIQYALPKQSEVEVIIYNLFGQEIITLVNGEQKAGIHTLNWEGRDKFGRIVASGIYLYRIKAGNFIQTKKMVLLK